jgi:Spy/CpxP family protein refolding chaperone
MAVRLFHRFGLVLICALLSLSLARAEGEGEGADQKKPEKPEKGEKGDKGAARFLRDRFGAEFVLKHADDLKLTDEQKAKIKELAEKADKDREALRKDAKFEELLKKMQEARKAGNDEAGKAAQKELRDYVQSKVPEGDGLREALAKILTPEQIEKLAEIRKKAMDERKGGEGEGKRERKREGKGEGKGEGAKPDEGAAPPNNALF